MKMEETTMAVDERGPADGVIDIAVLPTRADLRAVTRLDPDRGFYILVTLLSRVGAGALAACLAGVFLWFADPASREGLTLATGMLAAGIVGIAAFRFAVEQRWKRRIADRLAGHLASHREPFRVRADGAVLAIEEDHRIVRMDLTGFHRLAETKTHLVLFRNETPVVVLPKTAFPGPESAAAFADFLRRRIVASPAPNHREQP